MIIFSLNLQVIFTPSISEGVKMTRSNRVKFRLNYVLFVKDNLCI